jgi:hypothetical protein
MTSTSITITVALFFVGLLAAFAVDHSRACNCEMNLPADPLELVVSYFQNYAAKLTFIININYLN